MSALADVTGIWYNQFSKLVQPVLLSDRIHDRPAGRDPLRRARRPARPCRPSGGCREQLGASRHAVREALKRLQESGLIRISHGGATRVRDWRHDGGLDLLLALAAQGEAPPELELERAALELRACIGADAARRCAERASAAQRAEIGARAEALAATAEPEARNAEYERLWDARRRRRRQRRLPARAQHAGRRPARARARRASACAPSSTTRPRSARSPPRSPRARPAAARGIAAELLERSIA